MRVLYKDPGAAPEVVLLPNTLRALQNAVGGAIQAVNLTPELVAICNEEGRLLGLEPNLSFPSLGLDFVGPVLFCGVDGEEFGDIPELWEVVLLSTITMEPERKNRP